MQFKSDKIEPMFKTSASKQAGGQGRTHSRNGDMETGLALSTLFGGLGGIFMVAGAGFGAAAIKSDNRAHEDPGFFQPMSRQRPLHGESQQYG